MDYTHAVILSIVEGLTEFLPISSTGHLVLTSKILQLSQTEFLKSFEIFIQIGAILAIVVIYAKTLIHNFKVWKLILTAFFPTAILGLVFYKVIKELILGNIAVTLWALFIGGALIILFERFYKEQDHHLEKVENLSFKNAFLIGVFQSFAMIPGVSRAAATILGGLLVGLKRKPAAEFSFLLALPTMIAATSLDLIKGGLTFSFQEISLLLVGTLGSFITAFISVKLFINFLDRHNFVVFGIYRMILALLFYLIFFN